MHRSIHVLTMLAATTVLAACAGGDGQSGPGNDGGGVLDDTRRPSVEQLAEAIRGGSSGLGVGPSAADCVAEVFVASDLSDEALLRYTGENDAETLSDADRGAFDAAVTAAEDTCGISRGGG